MLSTKGLRGKFCLCSTIYLEEHHDTSSSPREGQESKKRSPTFQNHKGHQGPVSRAIRPKAQMLLTIP